MELDKVNIFDYQAPSPEDILAAGPGAIAAPLSPAELMEIEKSQLSSDPVIRRLQKAGRGIGSLFAVETPLDYALSGLGAAKPVVAAGKGLVTLAHGTTKDAAKQIQKEGAITPKLGSYVEDMYIKRGDYKDVDPFNYPPQASYFSTADNPASSISAMESQIAYKLGKNLDEPISLKEIEDHGAIVLSDANPKSVFKMDEDDFMTYDLLGNPQSIDAPMGFEANDIVSFLPQQPKKILQGKDLVNFVKKNRGEKGIASIKPKTEPKDLVFVHNTSEDAIKSFDRMGGIPSPSIAVTKADQSFTGFGTIQLIGKPEKFDPLVDPRNKIYSADAYTPRAPDKIRLAKKGAAEKFKKDYKDFEKFEKSINAPSRSPLSARTVSYAFDKLKEIEEGGVGASRAYSTISDYFFSPVNAPEFVQKKYLKEIGQDEITSTPKFRKWLKKEKDKYFSQDGFFEYYDKFDGRQRKPYTLKNVVDNMVEETQRGGESGDLVSANRLRAIMTEQFKDLPDIKARKKLLGQKGLPFDFEQPIISALGKISDEAMDYSDDVISEVAMHLQAGLPVEQAVDKAFKTGYISDVKGIATSPKKQEAIEDIATALKENAMRPVEYFEAKPTRAVGFDEFAGAIVPEATSQEVIDILEKRGLKVIKQKFDDIDKDYGKGKIRQQFKDQFFSAAPIAAAASATAMIDSQDQGIGSL